MLKYKVGQRVKSIAEYAEGMVGTIDSIDNSYPTSMPYRVLFDDAIYWMQEDWLIEDTTVDLQAENERLKAALEQIAGFWGSDESTDISGSEAIEYLVKIAESTLAESEQPS